MITEFAAAKINLALHVTGKRDDGYHLLDSAVMFASDAGDVLEVSFADETSLTISGPFSQGLETDAGNLVLKALAALKSRYPDEVRPCAINLYKALPVASGVGAYSGELASEEFLREAQRSAHQRRSVEPRSPLRELALMKKAIACRNSCSQEDSPRPQLFTPKGAYLAN